MNPVLEKILSFEKKNQQWVEQLPQLNPVKSWDEKKEARIVHATYSMFKKFALKVRIVKELFERYLGEYKILIFLT